MKALTGFGLVSGAASGAAVMLAWDRGADAWTLARLAIGAAALSLCAAPLLWTAPRALEAVLLCAALVLGGAWWLWRDLGRGE